MSFVHNPPVPVDEVLALLRLGTSRRAVAETASNPDSSRSHCILTTHIECEDVVPLDPGEGGGGPGGGGDAPAAVAALAAAAAQRGGVGGGGGSPGRRRSAGGAAAAAVSAARGGLTRVRRSRLHLVDLAGEGLGAVCVWGGGTGHIGGGGVGEHACAAWSTTTRTPLPPCLHPRIPSLTCATATARLRTARPPGPAGNERTSRDADTSGASGSGSSAGDRQREANAINRSLSTLGLVILRLTAPEGRSSGPVPYRDSKLTFLLQVTTGVAATVTG